MAENVCKPRPSSNPTPGCITRPRKKLAKSDTRVLCAIDILARQQQAINLAFFRGMSQREIAAKTNTPLGTVKTRLELGLKKIYDGLKNCDEL